MSDAEPVVSSQSCPACGFLIDVSREEPLARVTCPGCGEKFLGDYRVYADWKKRAQSFASRELITAAVTAWRTAQGKLQLRGRLNEAFEDEATNLVRHLEGRK